MNHGYFWQTFDFVVHKVAEIGIVQPKAYVVADYALTVACTAVFFAPQHFSYLGQTAELAEIFETAHVCHIVAKHFVECGVAVLKTARVHWHYEHAGLEYLVVVVKNAALLGHARHYHVAVTEKLVDGVNYGECDVAEAFETLNE